MHVLRVFSVFILASNCFALRRIGGTQHCLRHVWESKLEKHAEMVRRRWEAVARDPQAFLEKRTAYDAFEPTYTCHSEWRRGKFLGDGGKYVCGEPAYFRGQRCLVYSVGSNGDASFEADIISRFGCDVHTFDPSGDSPAFEKALKDVGAHFYPWGIGPADTTYRNDVTLHDNEMMGLLAVQGRLGHNGSHIDILKVDCEGCEFDAFAKLWPAIKSGVTSIGQIQVELHGTNFTAVRDFFKGAEAAGYMVFHKERNHWGCHGYLCVEYSLISKHEAQNIFKHTHCV